MAVLISLLMIITSYIIACGNSLSMEEVEALVTQKCVLLFIPPSDNDTAALLEQARQIFSVSDKIIVDEFVDNVTINWRAKEEQVTFNGEIALYTHVPKDRKCLMTYSKPVFVPERYPGRLLVADLVHYVNEKCGTFVTANGGLTPAGLLEQYILHHMFEPTTEHAECERIKMPTKGEFFTEYLMRSKPVIIEDALSSWSALNKWTNEFLNEHFGNNIVHIKLTPNGEFEGVESASLWTDYEKLVIPDEVKAQLQFSDLVVVRPATQELKFSEFLAIISSPNNYSAYLEYSSIPEYMPQLEEDLFELPMVTGVLTRRHLNIWLSDGNTLGKLHFDPYDNLLCQMRGEKDVTLYAPHHNINLYEAHIQEAILGFSPTTKQFRRQTLLKSTSMVMSPVDIKQPDLQRFPLFAEAKPYQCNIKEGDVLYMPAFWWHEVQSQPDHIERRNLAVNFWTISYGDRKCFHCYISLYHKYEPFLDKEFPCAECQLRVNLFYKHLLERPPT